MDDQFIDSNKPDLDIHSAPPLPDQPVTDHQSTPVNNDQPPLVPTPQPENTDSKPTVTAPTTKPEPAKLKSSQHFYKRWLAAWWHKKLWTIPLTIVLILAILAAVPWTRYSLAGLVLKQNFNVEVIDTTTNQPVSNATVALDQVSAITDNHGLVKLPVHVGKRQLTISKQYYQTANVSVVVPILRQKVTWIVKLTATGRQVPLTISNSINGQPVANALIRVADTEATTNQKGLVTIVLPANDSQLPANFSANGYNDGKGTIVVTAQAVPQNHFTLTPAGKLYFLSQLSGTMDVVKTNLDGTDRQTVLAGTGNESTSTTVLIASRDWKYLVLESSRAHPNQPELYLINTATNDQLTTIDTTNANFNPVGWIGDTFIYSLSRNNVQSWQPDGEILKAYNAVSGQLTVLDQTSGTGTGASSFALTTFGNIYLINGTVIYTTDWSGSDPSQLSGKSDSLFSIKPDGSGKQDIQDFPVPATLTYPSYYLDTVQYSPLSIYLQVPGSSGNNSYYTLTSGSLTSSNISDSTFFNQFPVYISSADGTQTFWYEQRDGKNTLFIGDPSGLNGKQIATLSDYLPYGWYSDNYLIVAKDNELYILPVNGGQALEVTDYFSSLQPGDNYGG